MEERKTVDIIIVNNNYEKMARKRQSIIDNNSLAAKTNKKIDRARKRNATITLMCSILATVTLVFFILQSKIIEDWITKAALSAIVILCVFAIGENVFAISKKKLEGKRMNVLAVNEPMNFVTSIKDKTIKDFSLSTYDESLPYDTQRVYPVFSLVDKNGVVSSYSGTDRWNLTLLPMLFDVVLDAENTTLYLPFEKVEENDKERIREKIKGQINQEQINIEREAKEKVETELRLMTTEKEAVERLLIKNTETISALKKSLDEATSSLNTAESRYKSDKNSLLLAIDTHKKETAELNTALGSAREELLKKDADLNNLSSQKAELEEVICAIKKELENEKASKDAVAKQLVASQEDVYALTDRISTLQKDVTAFKDREAQFAKDAENTRTSHKAALDEIRRQNQSRVDRLANENKKISALYDKKLADVKTAHENELAVLKEKMLAEATEDKAAMEQKYKEEIKALHEEIDKLAVQNNLEDIARELTDTKEALKKEVTIRTAREKELVFEKEKIKTLETKLTENSAEIAKKLKEAAAEKDKIENALEEQRKLANALKEEKATAIAASGMQERVLLKEKKALLAEIESLKKQIDATKNYSSVEDENQRLKAEIESLKHEDIENVKKDCEERLSYIREERNKMEKKMREALESAAKEKAERIKGEAILRKYMTEKEQSEFAKKMAEQDAEIAKAREKAERAQRDSMNATGHEGVKEERKKPARHLVY